jgi:hypothetical protein
MSVLSPGHLSGWLAGGCEISGRGENAGGSFGGSGGVVTNECRPSVGLWSQPGPAARWRRGLGRRCRSWSVRRRCASGWWSTGGLLACEDSRGSDRKRRVERRTFMGAEFGFL